MNDFNQTKLGPLIIIIFFLVPSKGADTQVSACIHYT